MIYGKGFYGYINKYKYDVFGNQIKYTSSDGTSILREFDLLGNKSKEKDNTYSYDAKGNLLSAKNTGYDSFNQLIEVKDSAGKAFFHILKHNVCFFNPPFKINQ